MPTTLNVKWFGAKGDGVTDDTAAIQAVIDKLTAAGDGGVVYLPGTSGENYSITSLTLSDAGITIRGDAEGTGALSTYGNRGTRITVNGANYGIIIGSIENDVEYGFCLENLAIIGGATGLAGIRIGSTLATANQQVSRIFIRNVDITGFTGSAVAHTVPTGAPAAVGGSGIFVIRGVSVSISNVYSHGNYYGLFESSLGQATTYDVHKSYFRENTSYGVHIRTAVSFNFDCCVFESNGDSGFYCKPTTAAKGCSNLSLTNCYSENNCTAAGTYEVYLDGTVTPVFFAHISNFNSNSAVGKNGLLVDTGRHCIIEGFNNQRITVANVTTQNSTQNIVISTPSDTNPARGPNTLDANTTLLGANAGYLELNSGLKIPNNRPIQSKDTGATYRDILVLDSGDNVVMQAGVNGDAYVKANNGSRVYRFFSALHGLLFGTSATADISIQAGAGTPEGSVAAAIGSVFLRSNGGASTTLYIKESGAGTNTGWRAV